MKVYPLSSFAIRVRIDRDGMGILHRVFAVPSASDTKGSIGGFRRGKTLELHFASEEAYRTWLSNLDFVPWEEKVT